jgi:hypothetical protein
MQRTLIIAGLAALAAAPALSEEPVAKPVVGALPAPIEQAFAAVEARMQPKQRWAFTRTTTTNGATVVERYDPRRPAGQEWLRISPAPAAAPAKGPGAPQEDRGVLVSATGLCDLRAQMSAGVAPAPSDQNGTPEGVRYTFHHPVPMHFCPGESGAADQTLESLLEHADGDVIVNPDGQGLVSNRIWAPKPFMLGPMSWKAFDATSTYGEVAPGGPIARLKMESHVDWSLFLQHTVKDETVVLSDFERVDVPDDGRGDSARE